MALKKDFVSPIVLELRAGTSEDPYIYKVETGKSLDSNAALPLEENPSANNTGYVIEDSQGNPANDTAVTVQAPEITGYDGNNDPIYGSSIDLDEIRDPEAIIGDNEFRVDYSNGILYFSQSRALADNIEQIDYIGKGAYFISANRVYALYNEDYSITVTLEDYIEIIGEGIEILTQDRFRGTISSNVTLEDLYGEGLSNGNYYIFTTDVTVSTSSGFWLLDPDGNVVSSEDVYAIDQIVYVGPDDVTENKQFQVIHLSAEDASLIAYDNTGTSLSSTNVQDAITELDDDVQTHIADTSNPHNVTKSQVGLGNVDNTSDADKPVSTAQQAALDDLAGSGRTTQTIKDNYDRIISNDGDIADIQDDIGDLNNLTTDDKSNLVAAINEVDSNSDTNRDNIIDLAGSGRTTETVKDNRDRIDALDSNTDDLQNQIGDLSNLTTDNKSNLVSAINEVDANVDDLAGSGRTTETVKGNADDIAAHVADTSNPHSVTKDQVGLGNVQNVDTTNASNITWGTLPNNVLPALAISETFVVESEAEQLNLINIGAEEGDICIRTDESLNYIMLDTTTGTMDDWKQLAVYPDQVLSVNGYVGTITLVTGDINEGSGGGTTNLWYTFERVRDHTFVSENTTHRGRTDNPHGVTKAQVGLGNVDNTSDADKPISDDTQVELDSLQSQIDSHVSNITNPHNVTKQQVGLGNVDNTSDADKPVSDATQTEIDNLQSQIDSHTTNYNNPHQVTQTQVGLSDVDNTSDADKPISTAQESRFQGIESDVSSNRTDIDNHVADLNNPHSVTAEQVDTYDKAYLDDEFAKNTTILNADKYTLSNIQTSTFDYTNAEGITTTGAPKSGNTYSFILQNGYFLADRNRLTAVINNDEVYSELDDDVVTVDAPVDTNTNEVDITYNFVNGDEIQFKYHQGNDVVVQTVGDGTITNAKLATDVKVGSLATLLTTNKDDVTSAINELQPHVNSDGSDHTFIDQDVTTTSTPDFRGVQLNTITEPSYSEGLTFYDNDINTLAYYNDVDMRAVSVGQEMIIPIYNDTGSTLTAGTVVHPVGRNNGRYTVSLAQSDNLQTSLYIAVVREDILNTANGYAVLTGVISMDTSSYTEDSPLFLSDTTPGLMTQTLTGPGSYVTVIGTVVVSDLNGLIYVDLDKSRQTRETNVTHGLPVDMQEDTVISFDDGTRTFTITHSSGEIRTYEEGDKYTAVSPVTITIPDTEGVYWIYFDKGTISYVHNPSVATIEDIIKNKTTVSGLYWDATNDKHLVDLIEGRRGIIMDKDTLWQTYLSIGITYINGLAPGDINADADGNLDSSAQFSVSSGSYLDYDITLTAAESPVGNTIPVLYYTGTDPYLREDSTSGFAVLTTGTGRLAWNELSGTTWQVSEVENNDFALYHLFYIAADTPQPVMVMGQQTYTTITDARQGAYTEITEIATNILYQEFTPVATFIYQTSNTYGNTVKSRIRSTDEGDDFMDWRGIRTGGLGGGGSSTGSHSTLTDRGAANQHPASAVSYDNSTSAMAATNVQEAIDEIDADFDNVNFNGTNTAVGIDVLSNNTGIDNTGVGYQALRSNTSANYNSAFGYRSLFNNTSGPSNTALGFQTLYYNTTGDSNVAVGRSALYYNETGNHNIAIGRSALLNNNSSYNIGIGYLAGEYGSTATRNFAAGYYALRYNEVGTDNIALGYLALLNNTSSGNVAIGSYVLDANTTGVGNTAVGTYALTTNTTTGYNTAVGYNTLYANIANYNTAVGFEAMRYNTSGTSNAAFGHYALTNNTTGANNAGLGEYSLRANTTGSGNTAAGRASMNNNTTGSDNTALGAYALSSNIDGTRNVALGRSALSSNTSASYNIAIGYYTLQQNTAGNHVAIGYQSMMNTTTGQSSVAIGYQTLLDNTTGNVNEAIGYQSMLKNTTGSFNTALGSFSLNSNSTGSSNVGVGRGTLQYNTGGNNNVAIGRESLQNHTSDNSTAVGYRSLNSNTATRGNAFGAYALESNTSGTNNAAFGYAAMRYNTEGQQNVSFGSNTLTNSTTSSYNVAIGYQAMFNATGSYSVAVGTDALSNNTAQGIVGIGYNALKSNTSGERNIAIGHVALSNNTTGSRNIAIGYQALIGLTTGANNIGIGENTLLNVTTASNNVGIGRNALQNNTASSNTAVGYQASYTNTIGTQNVSLGYLALWANNSDRSTALGYQALQNNTGTANVAVGYAASVASGNSSYSVSVGNYALYSNTSNNMVAVGYNALYAHIGGSAHTAIGYNSFAALTGSSGDTGLGYATGLNVTTGSHNTFIGYNTGRYYSGSNDLTASYNNTLIGSQVSSSTNNATNEIAIGYLVTAKGNNTATIGNSDVTTGYIGDNEIITNIGNQTINGKLNLNGDLDMSAYSGKISMQENNYINYRFLMLEAENPQYILLCANEGNNNVNGNFKMVRTSANYQAASFDVVVSSSTSQMYGGSIISNQVVQSDEAYELVTLTYNTVSHVAVRYTGNNYPATGGVYFTGKIEDSSGNAFTVVTSADVSNVSIFNSNNKIAHHNKQIVTEAGGQKLDNHLYFVNNQGIMGDTTSGTPIAMIRVNTGNQVRVGNEGYPLYLYTTSDNIIRTYDGTNIYEVITSKGGQTINGDLSLGANSTYYLDGYQIAYHSGSGAYTSLATTDKITRINSSAYPEWHDPGVAYHQLITAKGGQTINGHLTLSGTNEYKLADGTGRIGYIANTRLFVGNLNGNCYMRFYEDGTIDTTQPLTIASRAIITATGGQDGYVARGTTDQAVLRTSSNDVLLGKQANNSTTLKAYIVMGQSRFQYNNGSATYDILHTNNVKISSTTLYGTATSSGSFAVGDYSGYDFVVVYVRLDGAFWQTHILTPALITHGRYYVQADDVVYITYRWDSNTQMSIGGSANSQIRAVYGWNISS